MWNGHRKVEWEAGVLEAQGRVVKFLNYLLTYGSETQNSAPNFDQSTPDRSIASSKCTVVIGDFCSNCIADSTVNNG